MSLVGPSRHEAQPKRLFLRLPPDGFWDARKVGRGTGRGEDAPGWVFRVEIERETQPER